MLVFAETHDGEDIHKDAVLQENSAEATQAYHVSEEEEERKEKMECEPTVAYNLGKIYPFLRQWVGLLIIIVNFTIIKSV